MIMRTEIIKSILESSQSDAPFRLLRFGGGNGCGRGGYGIGIRENGRSNLLHSYLALIGRIIEVKYLLHPLKRFLCGLARRDNTFDVEEATGGSFHRLKKSVQRSQ